jgi:hypothetical protein
MSDLRFNEKDHPVISASPGLLCDEIRAKSREDLIEENAIYALVLQSYRIEIRQRVEQLDEAMRAQSNANARQCTDGLRRAIKLLTKRIEEGPT